MKFYHSGNYLNAEKKDGRQSAHVLQIITKLTTKKKKKEIPLQSEEKKTDQVNQTRTEDQHSKISERYESNHQMKCSVLMYFSIRICSHYQFFEKKPPQKTEASPQSTVKGAPFFTNLFMFCSFFCASVSNTVLSEVAGVT